MPSLIIQGRQPLGGTLRVGGNKNAVLPMIASLMLTDEPCVLRNVPDILDVRTMLDIARHLGAEAELKGVEKYSLISQMSRAIRAFICKRR